jgi:DNA-binding transcriptional ArsR family regulator
MEIVRSADQVAALLQPERARLLAALAEPNSASGLARRFNLPRQRLNYHLRELERAGLVELVEERRKRNCTERVVRATSRAYVISPEVLGGLAGDSPAQGADRLSAAYLVSVAARTIRDLAALMARARTANKRLATLTLDVDVRFASAGRRAEFAEQLSAAVAALAAKYDEPDAPDARTFRLVAAAYPAAGQPATSRRKEPS